MNIKEEIKKHLKYLTKELVKEDYELDDVDTTEYLDCLDCLEKINYGINFKDVILWFNKNDIDYYGMSDLDMYIYYIVKNKI